jgi:hypothetical protein
MKITDYKPDPENANLGTERGARLLEQSLRENGAGRSILVDKNGVIIAGNKTAQQARALGITDVIEVVTDGTKLVAVQRLDLDLLGDPAAERLAISDNRVGEIDLQWAVDVLQKFQANYPDILDGLFTEEDIEKIIRESKPEEELVSPEDMFDDFDPSRSKAGEKETMTSTFVFYGEQVDVISKALTTLGAAGLKERMLNLMNLPEV